MRRFRNLDPGEDHRNVGSFLKWKLGLGPDRLPRTPSRANVPVVENDGTALRHASEPSLTWIGHATYLVQLAGHSILTDPIFSRRLVALERNVAPGVPIAALPKIDVVTVSHNHYDHMDAPTLTRLGPDVTYVVPLGLAAWFDRKGLHNVVQLDWWQSTRVGDLEITLVPAQHWSRRALMDQDSTLWGGFVIRGQGRAVYHSGDTAYFSGFAEIRSRLGTIDAAMLPIGAYEPRWFMKPQHMDPVDAIQAFVDLGAERFFAMHWGTFKLTDEALDAPPRVLRATWDERGLDHARLYVPAIGETVRLGKG